MLFRVSLLLCLLSSASSQKTFWGESCPTIPKLTDFDLGRYLGVWYEAAKFPAVFQRGLECAQANYTLLESGSVLVDNSGLRRGASERTHAVGDATVEDAAAGILAVKFSRWQPRFSNYRVLDTDYESFAVVWSCALDLKLFNLQFLWLLTRQPRIAQDKYGSLSPWLWLFEVVAHVSREFPTRSWRGWTGWDSRPSFSSRPIKAKHCATIESFHYFVLHKVREATNGDRVNTTGRA